MKTHNRKSLGVAIAAMGILSLFSLSLLQSVPTAKAQWWPPGWINWGPAQQPLIPDPNRPNLPSLLPPISPVGGCGGAFCLWDSALNTVNSTLGKLGLPQFNSSSSSSAADIMQGIIDGSITYSGSQANDNAVQHQNAAWSNFLQKCADRGSRPTVSSDPNDYRTWRCEDSPGVKPSPTASSPSPNINQHSKNYPYNPPASDPFSPRIDDPTNIVYPPKSTHNPTITVPIPIADPTNPIPLKDILNNELGPNAGEPTTQITPSPVVSPVDPTLTNPTQSGVKPTQVPSDTTTTPSSNPGAVNPVNNPTGSPDSTTN